MTEEARYLNVEKKYAFLVQLPFRRAQMWQKLCADYGIEAYICPPTSPERLLWGIRHLLIVGIQLGSGQPLWWGSVVPFANTDKDESGLFTSDEWLSKTLKIKYWDQLPNVRSGGV